MKTLIKKAITQLLRPIIEPLVKTEVEKILAIQDQTNSNEFADKVKKVLLEAINDASFSI